MYRKALATAMALAVCGTGQAEWSGNAAFTSDYVFRGVSQSLEDPAVQAGVDYNSESGFYVGSWASSVDFSDGAGFDDGASIEWDLYLGYGGDITETVSWDVSYIYYLYPGTSQGVDLEYGELIVQLGFGEHLSGLIGYSNDVFASDESGTYVGLSSEWALGEHYNLAGTVGHYDLDDDDYTHWSLGVSRAFETFAFDLSYHDTNAEDLFGDIADSRIVFTVSAEF